jgi:CHAT domain-containing protein
MKISKSWTLPALCSASISWQRWCLPCRRRISSKVTSFAGRRLGSVAVTVVLAVLSLAPPAEGWVRQSGPTAGVVVEEVAKESPAQKAGIEPGDLILSWSREAAPPANPQGAFGSIQSPFDLAAVEIEEAPRGVVTLSGRRGASTATWALPPGSSGLTVRPALSEELLALYEDGKKRITTKEIAAGVAAWRGAAEEAKEEGKRWLAAWFLSKVGSALGELLRWSEADAAYGEAVEQVEQGRLWAIAAHLLREWGATFEKRSEWSRAQDCFRRSLECDQKLASESLEIALSLHQMGGVARQRGELAKAGGYHRRSLAIRERLAPGSLEIASSLNNLGILASWRGDLATAEKYYRRSLAIREKLAPESFDVAASLNNLGVVAWKRGDLATAEEHYRRLLQIKEKLAPEVATSLPDMAAAEFGYFRRSLPLSLGPDDGDVAVAEGYFQRAVTILEKLGPTPPGLAEAQYNLGRAKRLQRRFATAAERLCRAVDTLEIQRGRLGGADTTVFGATSASYYAACVGARIESGKQEEAFRVLERGRARAFLEQLAERHDLAASELPAEIATRRKELASAYDETQAALSDLGPIHDRARLAELKDQLREIRSLQDELAVRMRRESPRYASLHEPQTLDLAAARRALDPGTVLLSYAVDEEATYLLVIQSARVRGKGITAFSLPVGEKDLRDAIATFRNLLQNPGSDRRALSAQAQKLYDLLLRPAERRLAGAARLLVSPDGPLHILPFAALVRRGSYLAEWKPIHSVLSASVYAEIGRSRRPSVGPARFPLAAFGAPIYPRLSKKRDEVPAANLEVATAVSRGLSLDPLPSSQQEVEGIASLFPEARTFLGSEATEESAKAIAPQARLLHFACHGLLDEHSPLDSALALTIPEKPAPGQDNGLLQAWEIFDSLRLDADLVTLSACDSGLGKEMGSEGLIGLTRAFQFAGARSVLASLWSVSDLSTADLMKRFYSHLRAGRTKDEALQAAQIALIRSPEFSHPYHWAAFQLVGDWK